jgi:hypothetical protein
MSGLNVPTEGLNAARELEAKEKAEMDKNPLLYYRVPIEWKGLVQVLFETDIPKMTVGRFYHSGPSGKYMVVVIANPDKTLLKDSTAYMLPIEAFPTSPEPESFWNLEIRLSVEPSLANPNPIPWNPSPLIALTPA